MEKINRKQIIYRTKSRLSERLNRLLRAANLSILLILLAATPFLPSCKSGGTQIPADVQTRQITDDLGRTVKIAEKVERAVSLAPNLTEIAFAVGAGDKLVGVTTYCDYPLEAREIRKIGDTINPNIENIIALRPQIVLVSTASQIESFTKQLEAQNIAVFVTNPNGLDDIYKSINRIGEIFGRGEPARALVESLQRRVAAVESRTKTNRAPNVFVQISKEPLFTAGRESFITDLIARAGGVSLTKDVATGYPRLSEETALASNPDAIILSDSDDNREPNNLFKDSPAVRNGRVYRVSAELLARPGPRIVDGLEQIARALHPESFQ